MFSGPTIIPRNAPGIQRNPYSCVVCWKVVPAREYDFDNEMCKPCSKDLYCDLEAMADELEK